MTEQTGIDIHDYEWRCSCGEVGPPSYGTFLKWARSKDHREHMKGLVNKQTGKVVANSSSEARGKNIPLLKKEGMEEKEPQKPAAEIQEKPPPAFPERPPEKIVQQDDAEEDMPDIPGFEPDTGMDEGMYDGEDGEYPDDERQPSEYSVASDGVFRIEMILPADAFTLFNLAKAMGFERDKDITFNEWAWDCMKERFRLDYKHELILVPLARTEES